MSPDEELRRLERLARIGGPAERAHLAAARRRLREPREPRPRPLGSYRPPSRDSVLRRVRFAPYVRGAGPTFSLLTWDSGRRDPRSGRTLVGYRLTARPGGVIFAGEDSAAGIGYADDSDEAVAGLMSFLTLRPGDTDSDYFAAYTRKQFDFAEQHAEALGLAAWERFSQDREAVEDRRAARKLRRDPARRAMYQHLARYRRLEDLS